MYLPAALHNVKLYCDAHSDNSIAVQISDTDISTRVWIDDLKYFCFEFLMWLYAVVHLVMFAINKLFKIELKLNKMS